MILLYGFRHTPLLLKVYVLEPIFFSPVTMTPELSK